MTAVGFALRLFRRDWRNSELRLLALSLMLSVAAVTAVGFSPTAWARRWNFRPGNHWPPIWFSPATIRFRTIIG